MKTLRRIRFMCGSVLIGMVMTYALWMAVCFYIKEHLIQDLWTVQLRLNEIGEIRPSLKGIMIKNIHISHIHNHYRFLVDECTLTLSFKSLLHKTYQNLDIRNIKIDATTHAVFGIIDHILSLKSFDVKPHVSFLKTELLSQKNHSIEGHIYLHQSNQINNTMIHNDSYVTLPFQLNWTIDPLKTYPKIDIVFQIHGKGLSTTGEGSFGEESVYNHHHDVQNVSFAQENHTIKPKGFFMLKHVKMSPLYLEEIIKNKIPEFYPFMKNIGGYLQSLRISLEHDASSSGTSLKTSKPPLFQAIKFYMDDFYFYDKGLNDSKDLKDIKKLFTPLHDPLSMKGKINLWMHDSFLISSQKKENTTPEPLGLGEIMYGATPSNFLLKYTDKAVVFENTALTIPLKSCEAFFNRFNHSVKYSLEGNCILKTNIQMPFGNVLAPLKDHHYQRSQITHSLLSENGKMYSLSPFIHHRFDLEKIYGELLMELHNIHVKAAKISWSENKLKRYDPMYTCQNLSGTFNLEIPSFRTQTPVECNLDTAHFFAPQKLTLKNINMKWEKDPLFRLKTVKGETMDGSFKLHSFSPETTGLAFQADIKDISIQSLFDYLGLKEITGTGVLEGSAEGIIQHEAPFTITEAKLFSSDTKGSLFYKGLLNLEQEPITTPTLFTMLTLSLSKKKDQTHILFDVLGRNKGFQDGFPHRFSIQTKL